MAREDSARGLAVGRHVLWALTVLMLVRTTALHGLLRTMERQGARKPSDLASP